MVAHEILPVRAVMHSRGMAKNAICPRSGCKNPETVRHLLWECGAARDLWATTGPLYFPCLPVGGVQVDYKLAILGVGRGWKDCTAQQFTSLWLTFNAIKDAIWTTRNLLVLLITYNRNRSRLNLNADSWITIVSLIISGITESDLGLYFCGTKSDSPNLLFDKAIKVQTQDNIRELSKEDLITDDLTVKERVLMFGGVGLAILMFFLATITVGGIIHRHGWQKGWTVGKDATALNSD
ncbi:uncharacterized protein LOC127439532 [Myxocyprinus asiaticus]|uniref:uncharacterized protein LOC127439532 n=1 Tax=Myxocyprinus asiaticus TaxID=70543 RepID=UPI0022221197|nr:uncharacterized protein LOC127439532 [Myxocyprinus asiaticus]